MLNLKPPKNSSDTYINQITSAFKNRGSIRKIQQCFLYNDANDFNFRKVPLKEVKPETLNLNVKMSSANFSIPATMLKQCVDILPSILSKCYKQKHFKQVVPKKNFKKQKLFQ